MVLLDRSGGVLARLTTLVVGGRCELVLHARVDKNQLVALGIKREILVFQGLAVQTDQASLLSED